MFRIVARLSLRARTIPRRSPLTSVTAGALHRDVGAGAHRDADMRLGQSRGVVDPVAGHRDDSALGLELLDHLDLLSGSTSARTSSMPSFRATASAVVGCRR